MVSENLTSEKLRQILDYNPETGDFVWKKTLSSKNLNGKNAGKINSHGYRSIKINRKDYLAHRLAWLFIYDGWPPQFIDHINGNRLDNRICNLRNATYSVNNRNRTKAKGFQKVGNKFRARIVIDDRTIHLGMFETEKEANFAYLSAKNKFHPELNIHGFGR